jgi:hypothetical protein
LTLISNLFDFYCYFFLKIFNGRLGKKYGFNFNAEKDGKIGNLRAFVKKHKNKAQDNKVKFENENF